MTKDNQENSKEVEKNSRTQSKKVETNEVNSYEVMKILVLLIVK